MRKLRSLDVWKAAYALALEAYRATMQTPLKRHFNLCDQIRAACCSVPANLAEGYGLSTRSQLIRCARISLGSAYELDIHLELATDLGLIATHQAHQLRALCDRTTRLLIGLLRGLNAPLPRSKREA